MSMMREPGDALAKKSPVEAVGASFDNFTKQANAGKLAVDVQGGKALLAFASEIQQWYQERCAHARMAARAPRLGGSVAARAVAPFMEQVGVDEEGYLTMMEAVAGRMDQFKAAVAKAMQTYQDNEHDAPLRPQA